MCVMCLFVMSTCSWGLRLKQEIFYYGKHLYRAPSLSRGDGNITQYARRLVYEMKGNVSIGTIYARRNIGVYNIIVSFLEVI